MTPRPPIPPVARNRELLERILNRGSGKLEETSYPVLLLAMSRGERSGVLELRRSQLQKSIVFDDGSPVECRSNIATELLGRYLVGQGKISENDAHAAFAEASSRGVPLGEVLTERKLLTATDLYRALQQNLGRMLLEPFSWTSGTWTLSGQVAPVGSALRVRVPQLLVTGIMKVESQENADEAVGAAYGRYLSLADDPPYELEELKLSPEQKTVVEAARSGSGFDQLRETAGIDTDDLHRILHALLLTGIVTITDSPLVAGARPAPMTNPFVDEQPEVIVLPAASSEAPAAPTSTAAPPPAIVAAAESRPYTPVRAEWESAPPDRSASSGGRASADEVLSAYLSYRRKDSFDMLGLAETDPPTAAVAAFLGMAESFLPSRFDAAAPNNLRDKAKDVFLAAARAYAELADPIRREQLLKKRASLREHEAAIESGPAALIDPEALYRSGRALAVAGKVREALSSFEMAAECDAQNGTYAAEAAWCRYQLNATPPLGALKLLKNAIRIDPKSGAAHLYAGKIQAVLGNRLEAQAYMSRAAALMPRDPRPAEALKAAGFPVE